MTLNNPIFKTGFAVVFLLLAGTPALAVWQYPSAAPPGGNAPTPINAGGQFQAKIGSFGADLGWFDSIYAGPSSPGPSPLPATGEIRASNFCIGTICANWASPAPTSGQVLKYNGTGWAPGTDSTGAGGMTSFDVANTADATQFTVSGGADKLQFAGGGITTVGFDPTNDRVTLTSTEVGDISGVTAGSGLTGGGTTGSVTLTADTSVVQARVSGNCANGISSIAANGTATCVSGGGVTGSGTTGYIPRWTSASTLGDSRIFQTGTRVGIGTASPAIDFHVLGNASLIRLEGSTHEYLEFSRGGVRSGYMGYSSSGTNNMNIVNERGGNASLFVSSGSFASLNGSTGNFGIDQTSPLRKLHVLSDGPVARFEGVGNEYIELARGGARSGYIGYPSGAASDMLYLRNERPGNLVRVSGNLEVSGGTLNMTSSKITSLATPTANTDAANKSYVDGKVKPTVSQYSTSNPGGHDVCFLAGTWGGDCSNDCTYQVYQSGTAANGKPNWLVQASGGGGILARCLDW